MITSIPESVNKYLKKYADNHWEIKLSTDKLFNTVIVIPAIEEYKNIRLLLESLSVNDKSDFETTLILFVINNLKSSDEKIKIDNSNSLKLLNDIINKKNSTEDSIIVKVLDSGLKIGYVDAAASGHELNEKDGGVGLARKIGMDLALSFFNYNNGIKNILVCLDADCTVDQNYISSIRNEFNRNDISAAYVNYAHDKYTDEVNHLAIINYEIFLQYYILGLQIAKSPYAIHTIGSTMVCDVDSYIKVQGMNKRKAAEDFYFMEKLAKITRIYKINSTTVYPSSRDSLRVPFGTGQRVNRYLSQVQNEYLLYSPKSFYVLKNWLEIFNAIKILSADEYLRKAKEINIALYKYLKINSFSKNWERIRKNSKSEEQIRKQKILWFDGFKTLKLIHYLRDNTFPPEKMFDALDDIFLNYGINVERKIENEIPEIDIQLNYLDALRKIT